MFITKISLPFSFSVRHVSDFGDQSYVGLEEQIWKHSFLSFSLNILRDFGVITFLKGLQNSAGNPSGAEIFFVANFLKVCPKSLFLIRLFRIFMTSWFSFASSQCLGVCPFLQNFPVGGSISFYSYSLLDCSGIHLILPYLFLIALR